MDAPNVSRHTASRVFPFVPPVFNSAARIVCQFREGSISGSFSSDFSTFDAVETLIWGTPGTETIVERHWVGSRL
jgi:hypothetical protein